MRIRTRTCRYGQKGPTARRVAGAATLTAIAVAALLTWAPEKALADPLLPNFSAATFVPGTPIDNPYFPIIDGRTRVYVGQKEEGGKIVTERIELTDLGSGPVILGVQTSTQ